jgi:hypothetical protein
MNHTNFLAAGAAVLIAAAAIAGPQVAAASTAAAPHVTAVALDTAPDVAKGTVAIYFRTDGKIPRKAGGGSLLATAGRRSAQEASVSTFKAGTRCYVAYTKRGALKLGAKSSVHIAIAGSETTKRVTLRAADAGAGIGS